MFDFRYHALSLVAVFIALALGLLLGVAIGDSGLVSNAETNIREDLRRDVRRANERASDERRAADRAQADLDAAYPLLVGGQLTGGIGLVFLGEGSQDIADDVRGALEDTGASRVNVATIMEPFDLSALGAAAADTRYASLGVDPAKPDLDLVEAFGFRMAAQYVLGGQLIGRERDELFGSLAGSLKLLQGVVLVRHQPTGMNKLQDSVADRFEIGFAKGLRKTALPIVGIERSDSTPSQVGWFEDRGLTSVDNSDTTVGRAAVVYALAGAQGSFGRKSTADALLPDIGATTGVTTP